MIGFPQRSQNENSGKPIPATTASLSCLISFLQLSHFLTSIGEEELCLHGLELCDASLVLFKFVLMAAQLFGTGYIFCAMILKFFQNRVQFSNDGIKLFTQLLVHPLLNCVKNNIGLIGQKLFRSLGLLGEKMFHFPLELIEVAFG